jgi:hypothetical protein
MICYKNLKRAGNFSDNGSFGDIGTARNLAKSPEIAKVFLAIWADDIRPLV